MFNRLRIILSIARAGWKKVTKGTLNYYISQGLNCGKNCVVSSGSNFGSEPFLITLHDNVRLSTNVSLITHDGSVHALRTNKKYNERDLQIYGKIEIDDNTFIGANAIILPNVYIGKNRIVGAGTIVTHSVPDNSIVAGVPGRIIGNTFDFAEKKLREMPDNWDYNHYKENFGEYLRTIIPDPPKYKVGK